MKNVVILIIVLLILAGAVWYFVKSMGRLSTPSGPAGPAPGVEQPYGLPPGELGPAPAQPETP